jgi:NAD(P)-dependent dehydrogenase (short-subunit alcohol dehydrogenase family)
MADHASTSARAASDQSLVGKVAIVTGAGGDIGVGFARALGRAGASVVLADIDVDALERRVHNLQSESLTVIAIAVDVSDEDSVRGMVDRASAAFGGVDIIVNNAGLVTGIPRVPISEYPIDMWDRVMKVNLGGPLI